MVRLSLVEENDRKNDVPETRRVLKLVGDRTELNPVKTPDASKVEDLQYPRLGDVKPQFQELERSRNEPKNKNIVAVTNRSKILE